MSFRFRPKPVAALFTLIGVVILVSLGVWQLQRLDWKTGLIAKIGAGLAQPPTALPASIARPSAWDYRPVTLQGRWSGADQLLIANRTRDGAPGVHVLTPLERLNGPPVIVNRGWAPFGTSADDLPPPVGLVSVAGIARVPAPRGWMVPDNDPGADLWFWTDLGDFETRLGRGVAPVVVEAAQTGETPPIGGITRVSLRNNHLEYAIFWFALALCLSGIFVLRHLERDPDADGK